MALFAAACSNTTETSTAGDIVVRTPPTQDNNSVADSSSPGGDDAPLVRLPDSEPRTDSVPSNVRTLVAKDPAAVAIPSSDVLAAAIAQADDNSFSFDVGLNMNMNMMGMSMVMAPEGPVMSGEASGERMHAVMDMGMMMSGMRMLDEQGSPVPIPEMDELGDLRFEMWLDGTVMTVDMSEMASLDPTITGSAAQGPVSFDLTELGAGFGVDEVTSEMFSGANMYPGMGSMDPAAIGDVLRGLDAVVEAGRTEVDGRPVTVYAGTVSMADYTEAMGEDVWAELGQMDDLGSFGDTDAMVTALEGLSIEITVMVDDDDLLRRFEMFMDMTTMFESIFASDALAGGTTSDVVLTDDEFGQALEEAFEAMFAELELTMFTWMEFDDYGERFEFDPPPAVDLTDDAGVLFGDTIAA